MNLRLPIVLTIVAVAGGAAYARSQHPAAPQNPSFVEGEAAVSAAAPALAHRSVFERPRPSASPSAIVVYVAGAVAHGGIYRVAAGARADDAVRAAGGATSVADLVAVNLAARVADGDEVVVPEKGAANDIAPDTGSSPAKHKRKRRHKKHRKPRSVAVGEQTPVTSDLAESDPASADAGSGDTAPTVPVDLNSADANVLETLPGIGPALAERIVAFRDLNGPFNAPDDLLDVGGMTQKRLDAIEPFLAH